MESETTLRTASAWATTRAYLHIWYRASRPYTLSASMVPVLVGSAHAFQERQASLLLFALMMMASTLVQVGTNLVDEYADHTRPEASKKFLAPHKVIALGLLSAQAVKRGVVVSFGIATAIGVYLVVVTGWPILAICLTSIAVAYFYAGGPKPLGTLALGGPLVFVFMGPVMVMGTYYVYTTDITLAVLLLSIPVGCMVTAILVANDLRDLEEDRSAGKRTPVTMLGRPFGRWLWTLLVTSGFALVIVLATAGGHGLILLLPLLALPHAAKALQTLWRREDPAGLTTALRRSAGLQWWFGLMMAVGVGLGRFSWF